MKKNKKALEQAAAGSDGGKEEKDGKKGKGKAGPTSSGAKLLLEKIQ